MTKRACPWILAIALAAPAGAAPAWSPSVPGTPEIAPRKLFAMAYHEGIGRVVLFGGQTDFTAFDDTWEYDGLSWVRGPAAPPGLTARGGPAMAYDSSRGVIVLFGGSDAITGTLNDTWFHDGSTWTAGPAAPAALAPRTVHAMAFDEARARIVVFGGFGSSNLRDDTWDSAQAAGAQVRPHPRVSCRVKPQPWPMTHGAGASSSSAGVTPR